MADTTLYLIAYDIASNRRRTKLHKLLCGFGKWTQYSFFECFLTEKERILLSHRIEQLIDAKQDNVRIYHVCSPCQEKADTYGSIRPKEDTIYLL